MDEKILKSLESQFNMHNYLRSNEAARILGVTTTTLRRWHHSGKMIAHIHPVTGHFLYKIYDLQKFYSDLKRKRNDV